MTDRDKNIAFLRTIPGWFIENLIAALMVITMVYLAKCFVAFEILSWTWQEIRKALVTAFVGVVIWEHTGLKVLKILRDKADG